MQSAALQSKVKFSSPPVVETVLSVQFPELPGFRCAHFGLYWDRIKDQFPRISDQPRLRPLTRMLPKSPPLPEPSIELRPGGLPERVWYIAESDTELIQLQADRYLFNWRKGDQQRAYPSYDSNACKFLDEFRGFQTFCSETGLGEPEPEIAEVTYINLIEPQHGETAAELFQKVFVGLRWESNPPTLPTPEAAVFNRIYAIEDERGHLSAGASIAYSRETKRELVRLELTARVLACTGCAMDVSESLQLGHDWVVGGFVAMTDPEVQEKRWERTN